MPSPSSGGGTTTTTTQSNDPWSGQQKYLTKGFGQAESDVLNRPLEFFPGQTYVDPSQQTQAGIAGMTSQAQGGSPLNAMAGQQLADTMGGSYLTGGQGFDQAMQAAMDAIRPGIDSQFAGAGRYGSGLHAQQIGKGFGQAAAGLYGQERDRMMGASGMAAGVDQANYAPYQALMQAGQMSEGYDQQNLQDQINRWNFDQGEPTNRLGQYMGLIGGNYGGESTSTQSAQQSINPFMMLGGMGMQALPWMFM